MEKLHYIDVCFAVLLLLLSVKGFHRGFIRSCGSLAGIIIGISLATKLYINAGLLFGHYVYHFDDQIDTIIGFVLVLCISWVIVIFISEFVAQRLENSIAGRLDNALGFLLGMVKSFALLALLVFFLAQIPFLQNFTTQLKTQTHSYKFIETFSKMLHLDSVIFGAVKKAKQEAKKSVKSLQKETPKPKNQPAKNTQKNTKGDVKK